MENLMIVHLVYTLFGGVSVVAGNLIKQQYKSGISVAVAYVEFDEALDKQLGFEIEKIKMPAPKFWGHNMLFGINIKKIYNYFREKYPDRRIVIHAHNVQTVGLLSNIKDIPIVCTLHSMHGKSDLRAKISDLIYYKILKKLKRNKSEIVSVSQAVAKLYDKNGKLSIKTIYNATVAPENKKLKNKNFIIGHIGDISYAKGFDVLLKGFAKAASVNPDLRLLVAGKYKSISESETFDMLKNLNISDKVECLSFVANANKEVMPKVDLFVLASKNEAFGMTLIESMSYGIPVLATNVGGIPEILTNGYNGYFIGDDDDIAGQILQISADNDLYSQLSENAEKTFYEKFEINNMIKSYEMTYKKLVGNDGCNVR